MDDKWFATQIDMTALDLRVAMAQVENDEALKLTGLEPVILAIAYKAVVGVVSGFTGRLMYDKWKSARSRKNLDEIAARLSRTVIGALQSDTMDDDVIKTDVINALTLEGLSLEQAHIVCDRTFTRVKDQLHKA
ncbi:hypothetical protein [Amycolatopsis vastitatis]|uniref:Uncharacterized protein n=1 Tax=Amycolatopsis vastitatis TaxID=1905142 RepID=A0A229SNW6_9PSEU|nr:hypothetical protein [Amycolatopsis vastitatis]OXM60474.1 hypothetical protein CF165_42380 [Amycolatopsis vastitatis]